MSYKGKMAHEYSIHELDRELVIRGAQSFGENLIKFRGLQSVDIKDEIMAQVTEMYRAAKDLTPNIALAHLDVWALSKLVLYKTAIKSNDEKRGIRGEDNRRDICKVKDADILRNSNSIAAICLASSLVDMGNGDSLLETRNFGKHLNLNENEPFRHQPIAAGLVGTAFLVKDDVMATAGHCVNERNLDQLRFVFGYKMRNSTDIASQVPNQEIFSGKDVIARSYHCRDSKSDWALVKLQDKVLRHPVVKLSGHNIESKESVYVIGHPLGLPLKYAPGAKVNNTERDFFSADLDIYSRNSGSPVFDAKTHEVVGIVVRGDVQDFRWTGKNWISIIYPNPQFRFCEPQCTQVREFAQYC